MRLLRIVVWLYVLSTLPTHAGESASPLRGDAQRVGEIGFTFVLRGELARCEYQTFEGERFEWKTKHSRIEYHREINRKWESIENSGKDFCSTRIRSTSNKVMFSPDKAQLTIYPKPPEPFGRESVTVASDTQEHACEIASEILESIVYTNTLQRLKIQYIAADKGFFVVRNELGQLRSAVIGDTITRDLGRVVKISGRSVDLLEARPGRLGGYDEVRVTLLWQLPE